MMVRTRIVAAAIAVAAALSQPACIPAKAVQTVVTIADRVSDALLYLDAAWQAFCAVNPDACKQYAGEYQTRRGQVVAAMIASRDIAVASGEDAGPNELRTAYDSLETFLVKVGAIALDNAEGKALTRPQPWRAPDPFGARQR